MNQTVKLKDIPDTTSISYKIKKFFVPNTGSKTNEALLYNQLYPEVDTSAKNADAKLAYKFAKFFNPEKGIKLNEDLLKSQLYPVPAKQNNFASFLAASSNKLKGAAAAMVGAYQGLVNKAQPAAAHAYQLLAALLKK